MFFGLRSGQPYMPQGCPSRKWWPRNLQLLRNESPQFLGLLHCQFLHASAEAAQGVVVRFRKMIPGILVAEFVDQQPVHILGRSLVEPFVAEAKQVEVKLPLSV